MYAGRAKQWAGTLAILALVTVLGAADEAPLFGHAPRLLVEEFAAGDLAQPGEERRLAPIAIELAHALDQGRLHYVARQIRVIAGPAQYEAIEAREIAVEHLPECGRIAVQHVFDELAVRIVQSLKSRECSPLDGVAPPDQSARRPLRQR